MKKALIMCLDCINTSPRNDRFLSFFSQKGFVVDSLSYKTNVELAVRKEFTIPVTTFPFNHKWMRSITRTLPSLVILLCEKLKKLPVWLNDRHYNCTGHESVLKREDYGIILVGNLQLLPLALRIRNNGIIIFDACEYYTRQFSESLYFKLFEYPMRNYLCNEFLTKCNQVITVSGGLRDMYLKEFKIKTTVLRNTPAKYKVREKAISENKIRLVHHGVVNKNRNLENLIAIAKGLGKRFTLDLYLVGSERYIERLKALAVDCERIKFKHPVLLEDLVPTLNNYDIGLIFYDSEVFNVRHCLPNKLFEYIQARIAVAISPSPDMSDVVNKYKCGFISEEFNVESMIKTLDHLTPAMINLKKVASHKAADSLCWEKESGKLELSSLKISSCRRSSRS